MSATHEFKNKCNYFYFAITMMVIGLCWNIYRTAAGVENTFSTFTEKELLILEHLFNFRANLGKAAPVPPWPGWQHQLVKTIKLPLLK
ncbi:MAG: hypothetical protein HY356_04045 [Gammaproteobacteria bacterium]|nr:hypothetical protein [Gammaproteobacteria bacterium]